MTPQQLLARASALSESGGRRLLGITGPPGAGKSTLAAQLVTGLRGRAVSVPMDGFHLAEQELRRLGRTRRKGAPDTFDPLGYAALLGRLRDQRHPTVVYAPAFDRGLEEPVAGSIPVTADVPLVITEGNYLLLDEEPWSGVRQLLDEVWYVQLDDVERVRRLVDRHEHFGRSRPAAERWVRESDEANARRVVGSRHRSDLVVSLPTGPPWLDVEEPAEKRQVQRPGSSYEGGGEPG
ncbi:nucleoside/nucleotide kinase family protein [Streptomyces oceani]|uniref:nucleoside/nucleotide kinase family protein n=1 Tax=Streptomyces oceani TaxID=1075402 RepID=UPI0009A0D830|nr:nucleoside/nucleotide kinase family protein [Streptomyces oceani]